MPLLLYNGQFIPQNWLHPSPVSKLFLLIFRLNAMLLILSFKALIIWFSHFSFPLKASSSLAQGILCGSLALLFNILQIHHAFLPVIISTRHVLSHFIFFVSSYNPTSSNVCPSEKLSMVLPFWFKHSCLQISTGVHFVNTCLQELDLMITVFPHAWQMLRRCFRKEKRKRGRNEGINVKILQGKKMGSFCNVIY